MGIQGANVDQLRQLGREMTRDASRLSQVSNQLTSAVRSTGWVGRDADRFRQDWESHHRAALAQVSARLAEAASDVMRHADEQEQASSVAGGGGGGWGGTGGEAFVEGPGSHTDISGPKFISTTKGDQIELIKAEHDAYVARAGIRGEADTSFGHGSAEATIFLGSHSQGSVAIGDNGLQAKGSVLVGLNATADANWEYGIAEVKAKGDAGVGVGLLSEANIGTEGVNLEAEAFAGAHATGEIGANVGGVGGRVKGEAWAGLGASADVGATYENGVITIDFGIGAALGVGGKVETQFTIDIPKAVDTARDAGRAVAGWFGF